MDQIFDDPLLTHESRVRSTKESASQTGVALFAAGATNLLQSTPAGFRPSFCRKRRTRSRRRIRDLRSRQQDWPYRNFWSEARSSFPLCHRTALRRERTEKLRTEYCRSPKSDG